jgi:hypothetical protein
MWLGNLMDLGYHLLTRSNSDAGTRRAATGSGRDERLDPTADGTRQVAIMIASSGFGLLALFSLLSILLGEDRRRHTDPSETYEFGAPWTR